MSPGAKHAFDGILTRPALPSRAGSRTVPFRVVGHITNHDEWPLDRDLKSEAGGAGGVGARLGLEGNSERRRGHPRTDGSRTVERWEEEQCDNGAAAGKGAGGLDNAQTADRG